jgi:hypothetical protein
MVFDIQFKVNGVTMTLNPYTVSAFDKLQSINNEMMEYEKVNSVLPEIIDRKIRAKWWKRKADILWKPDARIDESFFESADFERSYLIQSEDFFTAWHWRR